MGMFDYFSDGEETAQLKIGPCIMNEYKVGSLLEAKDGVYQGSGCSGWVVIKHNKVVFVTSSKNLPEEFSELKKFNNYGESIET